jgi:hypothetical protein
MIPDVRAPREVVEYTVVRNGTMDRDLVKSEQRVPPPIAPPPIETISPRAAATTGLRADLLKVLSAGGWWTAAEVAEVMEANRRKVGIALKDASRVGLVEREAKGLGLGRPWGLTQRYRIVTAEQFAVVKTCRSGHPRSTDSKIDSRGRVVCLTCQRECKRRYREQMTSSLGAGHRVVKSGVDRVA